MKTNCIDYDLGRNFKLCSTLINLQYREKSAQRIAHVVVCVVVLFVAVVVKKIFLVIALFDKEATVLRPFDSL